MDWEYGREMLQDEEIESLDDWSDDKEMAFKIMDRDFDYLWSFDDATKSIKFIDRGYSDHINDEMARQREVDGTAELTFHSFEDVFEWIVDRSFGDEYYAAWIAERLS